MVLVEAFFRFNVKKMFRVVLSSILRVDREDLVIPTGVSSSDYKDKPAPSYTVRHLWRDAARFEIRNHRYCTLLHSWISLVSSLVLSLSSPRRFVVRYVTAAIQPAIIRMLRIVGPPLIRSMDPVVDLNEEQRESPGFPGWK